MIKWKLAAAIAAFAGSGGADASPPSPPSGATPPRLVAGSITNADYPSAAIRAREQGATKILIQVSAEGRATHCEVIESSGSAVLDTQSCTLATERFRFEPGRDLRGDATASTYQQGVRWILPDDTRSPLERSVTWTTATIRNGRIVGCVTQLEDGSRQESSIELCQQTFVHDAGAAVRSSLSSLTQVVTVVPRGAAPFEVKPEWGQLRLRVEAEFVIGPDGQLVSCRVVTPLPGQPAGAPCPPETEASLVFGPAAAPRREARMTAALFGVPSR